MKQKARNGESISNVLSFYPFKKPCPICGAWLDCLTHAHMAKHNTTMSEFIKEYVDTTEGMPLAPLSMPADDTDFDSLVVSVLAENPKTWITARYAASTLELNLNFVRSRLRKLDSLGLIESNTVRRSVLSESGIPKQYNGVYYRVAGGENTHIN